MKNYIKEKVIEMLSYTQSEKVFNEIDFKCYFRKFNRFGSNPHSLALRIYDCFICNSKV